VRAAILLFFPIIGISADFFQYLVAPGRVFDGSYSTYHVLNPFRTLANWRLVEALRWQWGPLAMGLIGLVAYLELYRLNRREDKNAAHSR
jgi:hypothetical protein